MRRADPGAFDRQEGPSLQNRPEIRRVDIGDDLTGILVSREHLGGQFVQPEQFRPRDLDRPVDRVACCEVRERVGNVFTGDGLRERRRHGHGGECALLHDAGDELEELGRAQDGKGDWRGLEQVLLNLLGLEVSAGLQSIVADNGEGDAMIDAGRLAGGGEVPARSIEEPERSCASSDGEFDTSTTTWAPSSAAARPSPVTASTPKVGEASSTLKSSCRRL